ncbi:MAG: hypothetical protein AMXMBFR84_11910 [Candidatus Hydrogenedentota bacterium]
MIEAKGLTKYYGSITAISGITFQVDKGEVIGFLGPNGAGKSTTMRILTGFTVPSSGTARIAGYLVEDQPLEAKRCIGYLPESVPLYPEMLVESFLRFVAEAKGLPRGQRKSEVGRVIERTGLAGMEKRVVGNLSKGYRQRVGLAQALLGNPPVLILDEPTVGLDPKQIIEIRQLIKELAANHTVLLSTHILSEVTMVCQRVVIINRGRVVAQDAMANLAGEDGKVVYRIEAAGPRERVLAVLQSVSGLCEVRHEGGFGYKAMATLDSDPSEALAKALVANDCRLTGLSKDNRTLEDIFIRAISSEQEAAT